MPNATSRDGLRINYEMVGSGPPLVLHHIFTGDLRDFHKSGLVDAIQDRFTLLLMDARGHGRSDAPHDPASYSLPIRARDVVSVLDTLGIDRAHFLGYSLGGGVGWAIAKYIPERFTSLIIGGAHPYPVAADGYEREINLLERGMEEYVSAWESAGLVFMPEARMQMLACDPLALRALRLARLSDAPLDDVLPEITLPCLLIAGGTDEPEHSLVQQAASVMPNATFVSLPGMDHLDVYHRGEVVAPHVVAFLEKLTA